MLPVSCKGPLLGGQLIKSDIYRLAANGSSTHNQYSAVDKGITAVMHVLLPAQTDSYNKLAGTTLGKIITYKGCTFIVCTPCTYVIILLNVLCGVTQVHQSVRPHYMQWYLTSVYNYAKTIVLLWPVFRPSFIPVAIIDCLSWEKYCACLNQTT